MRNPIDVQPPIQVHGLFDDDYLDNSGHLATVVPVRNQAVVQRVINSPISTGDGRSEWCWVTLANGDVILGVFPQGATYEWAKPTTYGNPN